MDESLDHAQRAVPTTITILVDPGIKALVDALNRIPFCMTIFSCEGHRESEFEHRAYVSFMSLDNAIANIATALRSRVDARQRISGDDTWELRVQPKWTVLYVEPESMDQVVEALSILGKEVE